MDLLGVLKHKAKKLVLKRIVLMKKNAVKNDYILRSEYEPIIIQICRNAIHNKNSEMLISPVSGKRFVNNTQEQMYIIITDTTVDVINHKYHYSTPICPKTYNTILNMFDGHVEQRRADMELDIRSNIKHSLETICSNLKK